MQHWNTIYGMGMDGGRIVPAQRRERLPIRKHRYRNRTVALSCHVRQCVVVIFSGFLAMAAVLSFATSLQPRAPRCVRPWLLLPGPHQASMSLIRQLPSLSRTSTWSLHVATCRSLPPSNTDPLPEEPSEDTPAFITGVNWWVSRAAL